MAIDNIVFRGCAYSHNTGRQCRKNEFKCDNGPCISLNQRCDFSKDCCDGSDEKQCKQYNKRCDFEKADYCQWLYQREHGGKKLTRWNRVISQNIDTFSPSTDHTLGTYKGHFMAIDASHMKANSSAQLRSPIFTSARIDVEQHIREQSLTKMNGTCYISFFYYQSNGFGNRLVVKVYEQFSNPQSKYSKIIKTFSDDNDWGWKKAFVTFETSSHFKSQRFEGFEIVIEAIIGPERKGMIAVDDVMFSPGCHLKPCGKDEFDCGDGQCVKCPNNSCHCNFTWECRNKADEVKNCSHLCSYEQGDMCGWKNAEENNMNWAVIKGYTPSNETGPPYDHTLKTKEGHYLYVDAKQKHKYSNHPRSLVVSPLYHDEYAAYNCIFSFWYNMYHSKIYQYTDVCITVYYRTMNGDIPRDTVLVTHYKTTKIKWKLSELQLPKCPRDFSIVIKTELYWKSETDTAIDDLMFNCTNPKQPTFCDNKTSFQCHTTNQCVTRDMLCDIDRNCCDGSDESAEQCEEYTKMNFTNGIDEKEGWHQLMNDDIDFLLTNGKTETDGTGPNWDHTYEEQHGKYIYIQGDKGLPNQTAVIGGPTIKAANYREDVCLVRFWYHMFGQDMGTLNVYIAIKYGEPHGSPIWNLSGNQGNQWKRGSVQLNCTSNFQVLFSASIGTGHFSDLALDDISFTPGCVIVKGETLPGQPTTPPPSHCNNQFSCRYSNLCIPWHHVCDFYNDCGRGEDESEAVCGYPIGFENGFKPWKIPSGPPVSFKVWNAHNQLKGTQPPLDALNRRNGSYIYFDTSMVGKSKTYAVIESPVYQNSYPKCKLNFFYHMSVKDGIEDDKFKLTVHLITDEDGAEAKIEDKYGTSLFVLVGNKGKNWNEVNLTIGRRRNPFKIRFIALMGGEMKNKIGDIAIDQINFLECGLLPEKCDKLNDDQFPCKNQRCINISQICNFVDDCGDLSDEDSSSNNGVCNEYLGCDFEDDNLCNFTQDKTDDFDWTRLSGFTSSYNTGPEHDHSNRTKWGHYMYIEGSGVHNDSKLPGSVARLRSFPIINAGTCKIKFFYHMYGLTLGHLNINVYSSNISTNIKSLKDKSKFLWREEVIDLSNITGVFQIEFEGVIGKHYSTDIAIDDIVFYPGCKSTSGKDHIFPNPNPCPEMFMCVSGGNCVPSDSHCNKSKECRDGSDEAECFSPDTHKKKQKRNDSVTVAALSSVLALLLLTTGAIMIILRRRSAQKFHLFSIFYEPSGNQGFDKSIVRQVSEVSVISSMSNPTYGNSPVERKPLKNGSEASSMASSSLHYSTSPSSSPFYHQPFYLSKPGLQ